MKKCPHNNWIQWSSLPNKCIDCGKSGVALVSDLTKKLRTATQALEYYAQPEIYKARHFGDDDHYEPEADESVAVEALNKIK